LRRAHAHADRRGGEAGDEIADGGERLPPAEPVRGRAATQLGQGREPVGRAFDEAERRGAGAEADEDGGQDGRGGLVRDVGQEARERQSDRGAVEPRRVRHASSGSWADRNGTLYRVEDTLPPARDRATSSLPIFLAQCRSFARCDRAPGGYAGMCST